MLTEERFARIIALVDRKGSATVAEMMREIEASESTIRRDLETLDKTGQLIKVRGGAISKKGSYSTRDDEVVLRQQRNVDAKESIAKYAASLIESHDFVYIDAGTTTEKMLKYINNHEAVYVTNAVSHAMKLASIGCTVFILGGEFKYATEAIVGEEAIASLSKYNFTKGFFGSNGITVKNGFTTPEIKEALIKRQAMASCKQCYVLADHSKFGEISSVSFGGVDEATIITDKTDDNLKRTYKNLVEVVQ
ncbi:MAG: DeoR/GlpR transcriptional regulator [Lachnospiraceae bacterium]|jgi:DeoR family fructose operon transcriptional repressor|nr:DeoR/GlpR transcriptional regulator [Lachnospiraceae bacterium]MBQ1607351.1 DeoR/GlpR transcriptional regulator [Lachnospiraceae bacterium]MBQ1640172.1 DeoR/GlpR transcriptional regulator [Lachnospiraceae bacterium]MBQ1720700.1 DeoR/GlpR transcriptional regulator [Lachnospiraceae bacterium]MBQ2467151.1 DeoR/GlpR transcriptional regulator [Lachnospiraceae bacterium]